MSEADPRGLIREAYRIEGITSAECRSIFLDWAIGQGSGIPAEDIRQLLERYGPTAPEHPMTAVLTEALGTPSPTGRRGGWRGRRN